MMRLTSRPAILPASYGDDRFGDCGAQIAFCVALELLENHCGDFLRRIGFAVDGHLIIGAHLALDGRDGSVRIGDGLTFCNLADHTFVILGESHHGRRCAGALCVCDDDRLGAFNNGYARIGCTKIDANDFSHNIFLLSE